MNNSTRRLMGVMVVGVLVGATLPVFAQSLPPGGTFVDDDGNTHEANIEAIAAAGITKGCNPPTNDQYCPSDPVTRGQMAAFLVRALGLTDDGGKDWFDDDNGSTFEADINKLAAAGITKGCNPPDNTLYCPSDSVTRGQMAAFLVRAMGYVDDGGKNWFGDDDGTTFEADINTLAQAGVTKGCNPPDNTLYCPDDPVLRDQMASFLARALNLTPIVPPPPTSTTTTSATTTSSTGGTTTTTSATTTTTMATTTTTTATFAIDMSNFLFSPDPVTVSAGTTVTWTNTQGIHTTTSGDGSTGAPDGIWDSGTLSTVGDTYSVTFTTPGTYTYYCTFHWSIGMVGTITVTG